MTLRGSHKIAPARQVQLLTVLFLLSIACNALLSAVVKMEYAAMRKAEALAGASFEREHRLVVESMKLRASGAALKLACEDTGNALAQCTARLAACRHGEEERREP